jgi:hypothetical protein
MEFATEYFFFFFFWVFHLFDFLPKEKRLIDNNSGKHYFLND